MWKISTENAFVTRQQLIAYRFIFSENSPGINALDTSFRLSNWHYLFKRIALLRPFTHLVSFAFTESLSVKCERWEFATMPMQLIACLLQSLAVSYSLLQSFEDSCNPLALSYRLLQPLTASYSLLKLPTASLPVLLSKT